eukprot:scaffold23772_cov196-Cylindrotheca_fusiformis.AAC.1
MISAGLLNSPASAMEFPHAHAGEGNKTCHPRMPDKLNAPNLRIGPNNSNALSTDDDVSISLSSISEDESNECSTNDFNNRFGNDSNSRRSIFSEYWNHSGQSPIPLSPRTTRTTPSQVDSCSDSVRSLPEIPRPLPYLAGDERARSEPILEFHLDRQEPGKSILRKSGGCNQRRERSSSVSFDTKVDVMIFQPPPVERKGNWSKLFAE